METSVINIPLNKLEISKLNVRKDVGDVGELVDSIAQQGILQPILVRPKGSKYEIIIGSRRYAAAKKCRLSVVPAIIRKMSDDEAIVTSLTENLQRNNLEPKEMGESIELLRNKFGYSQAKVAKALGLTQQRISQIETAYNLVVKFEDKKISVSLNPSKQDRESGKAIPLHHTILVGRAFENPEVKHALKSMPSKAIEKKQVELAKEIAPLTEYEAENVINYFKMYPEKPIEEIVDKGLAKTSGVSMETYLSPKVARQVEEMAEERGKSADEIIPEMIQRGLRSTIDEAGEGRREPIKYGGVELPEEPLSVQLHNKMMWNLERINARCDFYTIGYAQTEIKNFIERLLTKKVKTLVDVRRDPVSQFKPEFSKESLTQALKEKGINYVHIPELGVPRDVRKKISKLEDFDDLWKWYDKHVIPKFSDINREKLKKLDEPYAFMCVELDPTKCHRHRLAHALESKGQKSIDL